VIDPSAVVEVSAVTSRAELLRRETGVYVPTADALGAGVQTELALGARLFDVLSLHVVGGRAWFSCGERDGACGGKSETFGGVVRGELPLRALRPFIELGLQRRMLEAPAFLRFGPRSGAFNDGFSEYVHSRFTGVDMRIAFGVGFPLGRGVYLDVVARASFGKFTWYGGLPYENFDPNVGPTLAVDIPSDRRTLHGFYSLGVALRFGGV
jgi:hypothetical protein